MNYQYGGNLNINTNTTQSKTTMGFLAAICVCAIILAIVSAVIRNKVNNDEMPSAGLATTAIIFSSLITASAGIVAYTLMVADKININTASSGPTVPDDS